MPELTPSAVLEIAKLAKNPTVDTSQPIPFAVVPNDYKVLDLSAQKYNNFAPNPIRKKQRVRVDDAGSFCAYYRAFSDVNSIVFADEPKDEIYSILDYHEVLEGLPRWGEHRLSLPMTHSEEWNRWMRRNGEAHKFTQMDFAEFLEDNAPDITLPNSATMLEVARDLSAKTEVDFSCAMRVANGSVAFKFSEQVKGTFGSGEAQVPENFTISIPVYLGGRRVAISARLRYRINSGKLTFWYNLLRPDAVERDEFRAVQVEIGEALGVKVLNGTAG